MEIEKTVDKVDEIFKRFNLNRKDLIWIVTILLMIVGWSIYQIVKKEYDNKITETTIVYKNDKFITNELPKMLDIKFSNNEKFIKKGFNILRTETKKEIKNSEKRTNEKLKTILKFLPDLSKEEDFLLKKVIEDNCQANNETEIIEKDLLYDNEPDYTEEYGSGYSWLDKNNYNNLFSDSILHQEREKFLDSLPKKKQRFLKRIFNKNE